MSIQEHPEHTQEHERPEDAGSASDGPASSFLQMFLEARPKRAE